MLIALSTVAHKGHAANVKETLQTKKKRCKQKRNAANKKGKLQTKKKRCKQKRSAANKSKGIVSQLMDDLDLINSVEHVEAMVNSIQKGVENVLRK